MFKYLFGGIAIISLYFYNNYRQKQEKYKLFDTLLFEQQVTYLSLFRKNFGISHWKLLTDDIADLKITQPKNFNIIIDKSAKKIEITDDNNKKYVYLYTNNKKDNLIFWDNLPEMLSKF